MTGYGKAETQFANKKLVVEIRSLNSKSMDLNVRVASQLRSKELDIRTLIAQRLERGKVDLSIYYQDATQGETAAAFAPINREAFAYYYKELTAIQSEHLIQRSTFLLTKSVELCDGIIYGLQHNCPLLFVDIRSILHLGYIRHTHDSRQNILGILNP